MSDEMARERMRVLATTAPGSMDAAYWERVLTEISARKCWHCGRTRGEHADASTFTLPEDGKRHEPGDYRRPKDPAP